MDELITIKNIYNNVKKYTRTRIIIDRINSNSILLLKYNRYMIENLFF